MKRYLRSLLLFIPFALLVYLALLLLSAEALPQFLLNNVTRHNGGGHSYLRLKQAKEYKNVDILFLGSSHVTAGFDPRIFSNSGYQTFNLGSSAQTPIQTYYLLERYLDSLNPRLVIIDAYQYLFQIDGVESMAELAANDYLGKDTLSYTLMYNNVRLYNTVVYKCLRDLLGLKTTEKRVISHIKYIDGGYGEGLSKSNINEENGTFRYILDPKQCQYFSNVISMLKNRSIPYIIIQTPYVRSYYEAISNREEFNLYLSSLGDYYNFNEIMKLDNNKDFKDVHHLNQNGVVKFDAKVLELLKTDIGFTTIN